MRKEFVLFAALALGGCAQTITPYTGPKATAEEREIFYQLTNDYSSCHAKLDRERGFPPPVRDELCKCVRRVVANTLDDGYVRAVAASRDNPDAVLMKPGEARRVFESMVTTSQTAFQRCGAND